MGYRLYPPAFKPYLRILSDIGKLIQHPCLLSILSDIGKLINQLLSSCLHVSINSYIMSIRG